MSAFVVDKTHIDVLVRAAINRDYHSELRYYHDHSWREVNHQTADTVGQMLWDENVRSVSYRYPHDSLESLPGRVDSPWLTPYLYRFNTPVATAVEVLKAITCFEYQSCEHPGWETSEAHSFCKYLKDHAINQLPGYDAAPWNWQDAA